jgi:tRNA threonylcarbamoyladenosine biosynthesis protein TsaB
MKLLAFDTSTEVMSIAVACTNSGNTRLWQHTGPGGAQASTGLIAAVMDLLQQADLKLGELDAICFGSGPGSFTGLRTACAVAQGLAFGAGVPVLPVNSLLAVAEDARFTQLPQAQALCITALLDARMDEMYAATFAYLAGHWREVQGAALVKPEDLAPSASADGSVPVMAGNVFAMYGARIPPFVPSQSTSVPHASLRLQAGPTAAAMLRLAPQLLAAGAAVAAQDALPLYVRDKVAQTTAERAAIKEAQTAARNADAAAAVGVPP